MLLRTRFHLVTASSFAAILLLAGLLAWSLREAGQAEEDVELVRAIVKAQYERSLLRDEFLLFGGKRAMTQWKKKTADLAMLLDRATARFGGQADRAIVAEARELFAVTSTLFPAAVRVDEEEATDVTKRAQVAQLRARTIARLRVVAHDLYDLVSRLGALAGAHAQATQSRTVVVMVTIFLSALAMIFLNGRLALVTIERRLLRLRDAAEQVAAGDLHHRLAIQGDDELADLGRAFDRMTGRLLATHTALAVSNRELEAFSYAVSHDLRAPLRSVSGFSRAVLEDYGPQLDDKGREFLRLADEAAQEMAQLIDDLLGLSRVSRTDMVRRPVDLSALARSVVADLRLADPDRKVEVEIADDLQVEGDPTLLKLALENLLRNAWKFTSSHPAARISFRATRVDGEQVFSVADDGAGFDMAYVDKLFQPFQRLHRTSEFSGTGIGLATVSRVVRRHGGRAWAHGEVEKGATFSFTLPSTEASHVEQGHPAGGGQPQGRPLDEAGLRTEQGRQRAARGE